MKNTLLILRLNITLMRNNSKTLKLSPIKAETMRRPENKYTSKIHTRPVLIRILLQLTLSDLFSVLFFLYFFSPLRLFFVSPPFAWSFFSFHKRENNIRIPLWFINIYIYFFRISLPIWLRILFLWISLRSGIYLLTLFIYLFILLSSLLSLLFFLFFNTYISLSIYIFISSPRMRGIESHYKKNSL